MNSDSRSKRSRDRKSAGSPISTAADRAPLPFPDGSLTEEEFSRNEALRIDREGRAELDRILGPKKG